MLTSLSWPPALAVVLAKDTDVAWDGDHSVGRKKRPASQVERGKLIWLQHFAQPPELEHSVAGFKQEVPGQPERENTTQISPPPADKTWPRLSYYCMLWSVMCQGLHLCTFGGGGSDGNWTPCFRHSRQALYLWATPPAQHLLLLLVTRHGRRRQDISACVWWFLRLCALSVWFLGL